MVVGMNGGFLYKSTDAGVTWSQLGASSTSWQYICVSDDGQYITALPNSGTPQVSSNGGTSFTSKSTNASNDCLAMSSTGQYQYTGGWAGNVYSSSDYGATWTARTTPGSMSKHALACSADGQFVAVGNVSSGFLWTSSNAGVNWTQRTNAGQRDWYGLNISDDGTKLAAAAYNGQIYTSTDSGANWTARASTKYWLKLTGNSDGSKLIAMGDNTSNSGLTEVWTSSDSGVNWTQRSPGNIQDQYGQHSYGMTRTDASGNHYFLVPNQFIKISTDNGLNWTNIDQTFDFEKQFDNVAVSGNGQVGFATYNWLGLHHKSVDGLQTWTLPTVDRRGIVACSYDGSVVLGIVYQSTTYTGTASNKPSISTDTGANWTDITGASTKEYGDGCMSSTGATMQLIAANQVFYSTNTGTSWSLSSTALGAGSYWGDICCSNDGTKVYACDSTPGYVYTSTNSGSSFTQRTGAGSQEWYAISCSGDGAIVYMGGYLTDLKRSTDSGVTWASVTSAGTGLYWTSIEVSDDGTRIFATYYDSVSNTSTVKCSFDSGTTWTSLFTTPDYQYSSNFVRGNYNLRKIAWGQKILYSGDLVEPKLTFML
jgi:hypothetical protein